MNSFSQHISISTHQLITMTLKNTRYDVANAANDIGDRHNTYRF